ncbi:MAG: hypothetical protein JWN95_1310 [Frankiales bacterium]|nr:hypothetical protein [Frankiales bacterium]
MISTNRVMLAIAAAVLVVGGVATVNSRRAHRYQAEQRLESSAIPHAPVADNSFACTDDPGFTARLGASVTIKPAGRPVQTITEWHCVDLAGNRENSTVLATEPTATGYRMVSVLLKPDDDLHVDGLKLAGTDALTISGTYWGPLPAPGLPGWRLTGGLVERRAQLQNGGAGYVVAAMHPIAKPCIIPNLDVTLDPGPGDPDTSWLLEFRNHATSPCAMAGYPTVYPQNRGAMISRSWPTRAGQYGGVAGTLTLPTVLLQPGESASALLEPDRAEQPVSAGTCTADQLSIGFPVDDSRPAVLPVKLRWCNPEIHPIVPGTSGSLS